MALINCDFYSEVMEVCTSMCVLLPESAANRIGMKGKGSKGDCPVLYLFHGLSDDHTIWMRRTSLERYVSELGIAVVMPNANRSFYTDMKHGPKYWTFISEELPEICRKFFHISDTREDNFAAGLSMGGYGAFKLALQYPDRFAAAASLSGVLDIGSAAWEFPDFFKKDFNNIFGEDGVIYGTVDDLFYLAEKSAKYNGSKPRLYQYCGTEDFLYDQNIKFRDFCSKLPIELKYYETRGDHDWEFWDRQIQRVLKEWFK